MISPEGCASILWRSAANANDAAAALKLTAQDLKELDIIDGIIPEPLGGAHRDREAAVSAVAGQIERALDSLTPWNGEKLVRRRRQKFLDMGRA